MVSRFILLSVSLLFAARLCAQSEAILEKPPSPWPNNLNVRNGEPGCWKTPGERFSRKDALKAMMAPFATGLNVADRSFGDIPADLHIDGFVTMHLPAARADGTGTAHIPCEVSVVHLGPRKEKEDELGEPVIKTFFLLTARGKTLWKHELDSTASGSLADHYKLARVVTRFDKAPFVLLFTDSGANTRNYGYAIYRVTLSGLEKVWEDDLGDGHTGSVQQWYSWSNLDFSKLESGRANEFTAYTTSGARRVMEAGDEKDLKPKYRKRVYQWDSDRQTFVKAAERAFSNH